jgi:glycine/sarcosine N-methyltransferase
LSFTNSMLEERGFTDVGPDLAASVITECSGPATDYEAGVFPRDAAQLFAGAGNDNYKTRLQSGPMAHAYNGLASNYALLFRDWEELIAHRGALLSAMIASELGTSQPHRILVPACGIGPELIGLAESGHIVTGCDISSASIECARREASGRGLNLHLAVADMRDLTSIPQVEFDAVVIVGNSLGALPSRADLICALGEMRKKLRDGGLLIVGLRDNDQAVTERPIRVDPPMLCCDPTGWRMVHSLWRWIDDTRYVAHVYIEREGECQHYTIPYRAVLRRELNEVLAIAGFVDVRWLPGQEQTSFRQSVYASGTGFDQIFVTARAPYAETGTGRA